MNVEIETLAAQFLVGNICFQFSELVLCSVLSVVYRHSQGILSVNSLKLYHKERRKTKRWRDRGGGTE
jgi:hypothetical protein